MNPFSFFEPNSGSSFFLFFLPSLFPVLARLFRGRSTAGLLEVVFWGISFLSDLFMGLQFALAVKIYLDHSPMKGTLGRTAARVGSMRSTFFGGLLGGVRFLPLLFSVFRRTHEHEHPEASLTLPRGMW